MICELPILLFVVYQVQQLYGPRDHGGRHRSRTCPLSWEAHEGLCRNIPWIGRTECQSSLQSDFDR